MLIEMFVSAVTLTTISVTRLPSGTLFTGKAIVCLARVTCLVVLVELFALQILTKQGHLAILASGVAIGVIAGIYYTRFLEFIGRQRREKRQAQMIVDI